MLTELERGAVTDAGTAGRIGDDVRSDLLVRFESATAGGLEVLIERSKVAAFYGDAIVAQIHDVLTELGIRHGRLTVVDDRGALPFTIAARVECAVRRALIPGRSRTAAPPAGVAPSARDRLRRSRLYLPGNDPKLMVNAGLYGGDGLILDLEDSVHPDHKDAARLLVQAALRSLDLGGAERMVRINQLPLGLADIDAVAPAHPQLLLIPKVESAEQVQQVDARVRAAAPDFDIWLMPILESALGIEHAYEVATASERVVALTIGLEDYTADLGVVKTRDGDESRYARERLVQAARAAGIQAIDSVYGNFDDLDGLRSWGQRARGMGFTGMGCIHPKQIRVVHEAFAPSADEIDKARRIVAAGAEARAAGLAVVSLGSKMIDPPVVLRAEQLVERARTMGLIGEEDER